LTFREPRDLFDQYRLVISDKTVLAGEVGRFFQRLVDLDLPVRQGPQTGKMPRATGLRNHFA